VKLASLNSAYRSVGILFNLFQLRLFLLCAGDIPDFNHAVMCLIGKSQTTSIGRKCHVIHGFFYWNLQSESIDQVYEDDLFAQLSCRTGVFLISQHRMIMRKTEVI